jgi:(1->4)-alpha-D-glucan 1-alpha-D-glucosylmutase
VVESELFLRDFEPFCGEMAAAGERIGLGQVLLKLTSPGVPDIYQGDELLNLALVDPDNRRPVDWDARRAALRELRGGTAATRATRKLDLIWRGLELRARRPEAFAGAYEPVAAGEGVCAFVRGEGAVLVVVGVREWEGAELEGVPAGTWREVLGDRERQLGGGAAVADLVNESGLALWERV